ncbi:uncharacterized protein LOC113766388 [Coffea eugenioides]|uniref:uncharacterized protein LOC113766388 n=1 Tax=Coffea eugenioides TaxID=49369 RepID=UPI000F608573|nr:uncharacterized protein LOC113766388 [Coffea eugenioides]
MTEGTSVTAHVLKMIDYTEKLGQLEFVMNHELNVDLILQSLPDAYLYVVLTYHMNKVETTLPELLNMLKDAEANLKKDKGQVLRIAPNSSKAKIRKSKSKFKKRKQATKPTSGVSKNKDKAKGKCFHCNK